MVGAVIWYIVARTSDSVGPDTSTTSERSSAVTIEFQFPRFGYTFADGHAASGSFTGMPPNAEVWLLVRPQGNPAWTPQGPCATGDNTWICANVRLNGPPSYYVLAAVVVPTDIAAHLRDTHEISSIPLGALGSTEITVNGEAS